MAINAEAEEIRCNDINHHVISVYQAFQALDIGDLLSYIDAAIAENHLSKTDQAAYIAFRRRYNATKNPLDLYVLVCYSFNYQFRFNSKHEFNNPFGKDRSSFNPVMRRNLIKFHQRIKNIRFTAQHFLDYDTGGLGDGDFLYADPPYLISCGSYNDGKRGFEGWDGDDDSALFSLLEKLDGQGVKFALSNLTEHKGRKNTALLKWAERYNLHPMDCNYNNSNYHSKSRDGVTQEVLITNY